RSSFGIGAVANSVGSRTSRSAPQIRSNSSGDRSVQVRLPRAVRSNVEARKPGRRLPSRVAPSSSRLQRITDRSSQPPLKLLMGCIQYLPFAETTRDCTIVEPDGNHKNLALWPHVHLVENSLNLLVNVARLFHRLIREKHEADCRLLDRSGDLK